MANLQSDPTELEGVVLALIERRGEATAYQVKQDLAESPSRFWSGSAGAVYPLVERLNVRGLLCAKERMTGRRRSRCFTLTESGAHALKQWLTDVERAIDPGIDPLRMRLIFANAVHKKTLQHFLERVEAEMARAVQEQPFKNDIDNELHRIAMTMRLEFLDQVKEMLLESSSRERRPAPHVNLKR